ncbi:hypothetical protein N7U66_03385 [Lacinutrix neustonica]|uniref:Uncharacterized protein n=1 Tax=Lacinutrix neustonica TaxID=2980107 RepID=A0A9E8MY93_9FLAO|nr:hypothetical protein [Lacinutrix neustonica]WAC02727.1 hypothetical protein N7U66_03385 [Lacinutrix neustonica]
MTIGQELQNGETLIIDNLPEGNFSVTIKDNYGCTFEKTIYIPRVNNPIANLCTTLLACGTTSGDIELSFRTLDVHSAVTGTNYTGRIYQASSGSNEDLVTFTGTFTDTQIHQLANVTSTAIYVLEIISENGCTYTELSDHGCYNCLLKLLMTPIRFL